MPLLPNEFDPGILYCGVTLLALLALCWLAGIGLMPAALASEDALERFALRCASGMLFLSGVAALFVLQRASYVALIPASQVLMALWARKREKPMQGTPREVWSAKGRWLILAVILGGAAFEWWNTGWVGWDGRLSVLHMDFGFFSNQARGMLESRMADGWSSTMAQHAAEVPSSRDVWYHWGPMWIAGTVTSLTGMMPLASLMHVTGALLDIILVFCAGAIVRRISGLSHGPALLLGAASMISVPLSRSLGQQWFGLTAATETLHLMRMSLAYVFSYKLEAVAVFAAVLLWLRAERGFALGLLGCAAIASPHVLAVGGVTAGVLTFVGLLRREGAMVRTGSVIIGALLIVWGVLHFGCGSSLPRAEGQALIQLNASHLFNSVRMGLRDSAVALVIGVLSLPGILLLIRAAEEMKRLLGWLALSSLFGSFLGYRLVTEMADNQLHFIVMAHALLIMPAGVWGLAMIVSRKETKAWQRACAIFLILLGSGMGVADLIQHRSAYQRPWTIDELAPIKKALAGRAFGYYSRRDSGWWMPIHGPLAAMLDARCARIAPMKSELPGGWEAAGTQKGVRPFELVPPVANETLEDWSLRYAERIGVTCLAECAGDRLPTGVMPRVREVARVPGFVLYEILPKAPL
ncbi:MAG: hypothetical protein IPK22_07180 [Verrucomicrobiaceae bacterium]|nr:hypothetical protein [Verrucomicrobiaceae bacterium]